MSTPDYSPRAEYVGTGTLNEYTFDFRITDLSQLLIVQSDRYFTQTFRVRGSDTTYLSSVEFDEIAGGGTVTLKTNLPNLSNLAIVLAVDDPEQVFEFRNKSDFTLKHFENALDALAGGIQRAAYLAQRSVKLPEMMLKAAVDLFNTELPIPVASKVIAINDDADGFVLIDNAGLLLFGTVDPTDPIGINGQYYINTTSMLLFGPKAGGSWPLPGIPLGGGAGLPPGGATGDALQKLSSADGDADWFNFDYNGFGRFGAWSSAGLKDTIDQLVALTRLPPTISLTGSGSGTYEKGATVASTTLAATVVKKSDPIAAVRFYQSPSTLLATYIGTIPSGGVQNDTEGPITNTTSYYAQVDDDGSTGAVNTVTSNTVSFNFIYPYYWGNGAAGLTPAQVAALTKVVATRPSALTFVAPGGETFYLAYPASQGVLTSIRDSSNFETITDWTLTVANITGLDATAQSYNIYEFNNIVTAASYPYTFS